MPYGSVSEAKKTHPNLSKYSGHAQSVWKEVFNNALEEYGDEGRAFSAAYAAANRADGVASTQEKEASEPLAAVSPREQVVSNPRAPAKPIEQVRNDTPLGQRAEKAFVKATDWGRYGLTAMDAVLALAKWERMRPLTTPIIKPIVKAGAGRALGVLSGPVGWAPLLATGLRYAAGADPGQYTPEVEAADAQDALRAYGLTQPLAPERIQRARAVNAARREQGKPINWTHTTSLNKESSTMNKVAAYTTVLRLMQKRAAASPLLLAGAGGEIPVSGFSYAAAPTLASIPATMAASTIVPAAATAGIFGTLGYKIGDKIVHDQSKREVGEAGAKPSQAEIDDFRAATKARQKRQGLKEYTKADTKPGADETPAPSEWYKNPMLYSTPGGALLGAALAHILIKNPKAWQYLAGATGGAAVGAGAGYAMQSQEKV